MDEAMTHLMTTTPVVLCLSDVSPNGGRGLSAYIETLASLGCHCAPIVTKLSTNDNDSDTDHQVTDTGLLIKQTRATLDELDVNLIAINDISCVSHAEAIHTILNDHPTIPLLFHLDLSDQSDHPALTNALLTLIFQRAELLILNQHDIQKITVGADTLSACAQEILDYGCRNLLVTGSKNTDTMTNHWFSQHSNRQQYHHPKLPGDFSGAGDTLSASVSAYLAHGLSMPESIQQAQSFTRQALENAQPISPTLHFPNHLHWCKK